MFTYTVLKNIICKKEVDIHHKLTKMDVVRALYLTIAGIGFAILFGSTITLGGRAAGDAYASLRYEDYEVGQYYLTHYGRFTPVSYTTWIRMKVLEQIASSMFIVAMLWNFIHLSKTRGIKYMLTGRSINHINISSKSTLIEKIGFSLLTGFMLFVAVSILIILF